MNTFLENAQRIFDVARADSAAEDTDFILRIQPDGGLYVLMGGEDAGHRDYGYREEYRVTRSRGEVRVVGKNAEHTCTLHDRKPRFLNRQVPRLLFTDQALYSLAPAVPTGASPE